MENRKQPEKTRSKPKQRRKTQPRYCAICKNQAGMILGGRRLSMHRFPSSEKDAKLKRKWIKRCSLSLADFRFTSYASTRLCGEHFIGGKGPTKEHNLPSIFKNKIYKITYYDPKTGKSTPDFIWPKLEDDVNITVNDASGLMEIMRSPGYLSFPSDTSNVDISVTMHDYTSEAVIAFRPYKFKYQTQKIYFVRKDTYTNTSFSETRKMRNMTSYITSKTKQTTCTNSTSETSDVIHIKTEIPDVT